MNIPVHFDTAEAERTLRAALAKTSARAMASALNDDGRELVRRQDELVEVLIAASIWHIGCRNRHVDMDIAAEALGYTLGLVIKNFAANSDASADLEVIFDAIQEVLTGDGDGGVLAEETITGQRGGNA